MQHPVDARQAWLQFCMDMNVEDVQLIGCSMDPVICFLSVSEGGNSKQSGKEFVSMGEHVICTMQSLMVETNDSGLVRGRESSSSQACIDGDKVGKEVSKSSDFNLVELLDHLGSLRGSLLVLMSGKVGDDVCNRDNTELLGS